MAQSPQSLTSTRAFLGPGPVTWRQASEASALLSVAGLVGLAVVAVLATWRGLARSRGTR